MKKLIAIFLAALMLLTAASAMASGLLGGWTTAEDPAIDENLQILFEQATEDLLGVKYTPVVYLGSQAVSGTNHCFLCQGAAVTPDARPGWYLIYINEDLNGAVSLMGIAPFDFGDMCIY